MLTLGDDYLAPKKSLYYKETRRRETHAIKKDTDNPLDLFDRECLNGFQPSPFFPLRRVPCPAHNDD